MSHFSVLLQQSIKLLNIKPNGIYVDGTFGRGGHTQAILNSLGPDGKLFAFDKDVVAVDHAHQTITDSRFTIIHDSFANIKDQLARYGPQKVDGVLLDLGVSSPQIDEAWRGFSFMQDGDLDMRMDNTRGVSCKDWLATVSEADLVQVLWEYGEERFARKIAQNILKEREVKPITRTLELARIIERSIPYREKSKHPATRSFQAIRIKINDELADLESFLEIVPEVLNHEARVVIISFHSLEDRIVKTQFNKLSQGLKLPKWVMMADAMPEYKLIAKKVKPELDELNKNARSRSAILRCLEKI